MKRSLQIAVATSAVWMICLSSCAGLKIKTWFLDGKEESALIRRKSGVIVEKMTFFDADGYRCYSQADDTAWRDRMALCCAGGK